MGYGMGGIPMTFSPTEGVPGDIPPIPPGTSKSPSKAVFIDNVLYFLKLLYFIT
jgi:hypothetical protein